MTKIIFLFNFIFPIALKVKFIWLFVVNNSIFLGESQKILLPYKKALDNFECLIAGNPKRFFALGDFYYIAEINPRPAIGANKLRIIGHDFYLTRSDFKNVYFSFVIKNNPPAIWRPSGIIASNSKPSYSSERQGCSMQFQYSYSLFPRPVNRRKGNSVAIWRPGLGVKRMAFMFE